MVGLLVRETILLKRAALCEHEWEKLNDKEDKCKRCLVEATPEGKQKLAEMKQRFLR